MVEWQMTTNPREWNPQEWGKIKNHPNYTTESQKTQELQYKDTYRTTGEKRESNIRKTK